MTDADTPAERANIERELDILRTRYAHIQKWAQISKGFAIGAIPVIVVLLIFALAADPMLAVVIFIAILAGAVFIFWRPAEWRWIDLVSTNHRWWEQQSEAQAIEDMIADRERRLEDIEQRTFRG
jgi:hypothetical protein